MSGGEEVLKASAVDEGGPAIQEALTKRQEQDRFRQHEAQRKEAKKNLEDYKKRLIEGNDLKRLQIAEMELSVAYHLAQAALTEMIPKMDQINKEHMAALDKANALEKKAEEEARKLREKPEIVGVGGGQPRSKE